MKLLNTISRSLICIALAAGGVTFLTAEAVAKQPNLANTLQLDANQTPAKATLDQISWIAGYWRGEAWGGQTEEIWSEPLGESMMASFKYVKDNRVQFYELITIQEIDKSLVLKLKHFDNELKGWEEKDQTVDFKLVNISADRVDFEGYSFHKINKTEMHVYVVIGDDPTNETKFVFRKSE